MSRSAVNHTVATGVRLGVFCAMLMAVFVNTGGGRGAYPGLAGFGIDTAGGKGGRIFRVTQLGGTGPGSFREAVEAAGPRIVAFEVAGVIDLEMKGIVIREPFLTVAGQTAPSPGITLIRGGIVIATHDVLIRHIAVRPGDAGQPRKSGWSPDALSTSAAWNVVIDHCSFTWAVDENLSASGPRYEGPRATSHDITFSNCIIAEGLNNSSHEKGPHSKGTLIHDNCRNIAVIGNLFAHNADRNPYFKADTTGVIVNNLIYNPGRWAVHIGWPASEWEDRAQPGDPRVTVIGNVLLQGSDSGPGLFLLGDKGQAYFEDNLNFNVSGGSMPVVNPSVEVLAEKPCWPASLVPLPASRVLENVLVEAGARPRDRDPIDQRIVRGVREKTGRIIDSQDEVGGYPMPQPVHRPLDIPKGEVEDWLNQLAAKLE